MAFLLRQISHSADGREIVRPSRVEGDRLTIGRDPGQDVHLTDLAVALQHAVLERASPQRLSLIVESGLTVDLNGRKTGGGEIELGAGGDIQIASHLLRIMPVPQGSDEIAIDVERITEGEGHMSRADDRRFSLVSVMPGKRPLAWGLIALVLALFLAWPVWTFYERQRQEAAAESFHADSMWTSGNLSQVHASLGDNCAACHAEPFVAVQDTSCTACHTQVHDHAEPFRMARAQPGLGTWGKVRLAFQETFNRPPGRCVDCHTEHEGPQEMAPTPERFCSDCHTGLAERLPDTRLGNARDFGREHPQFQPSVLVRWDGDRPVMQRVSLDANPRENSNLKFPHAMHLSGTNGVAQMARRLSARHGFGESLECADCHVATPDGTRFQPVDMEGDCAMCHSLAFDRVGGTVRTLRHGSPEQVVADMREYYRGRGPERPQVLSQNARRRPGEVMGARNAVQFGRAVAGAGGNAERAIRSIFTRGGACFDCHQVQAPQPGTLNYRIRPVAFPVRYMHNGWFDHKPHAQEDCASCHAADSSDSANDLLLPDLASCQTCHGGENSRADVPSTCAMCHDYHMDEGTPSLLLRQRVRGRRWESTVIAVEPQPAAGGGR